MEVRTETDRQSEVPPNNTSILGIGAILGYFVGQLVKPDIVLRNLPSLLSPYEIRTIFSLHGRQEPEYLREFDFYYQRRNYKWVFDRFNLGPINRLKLNYIASDAMLIPFGAATVALFCFQDLCMRRIPKAICRDYAPHHEKKFDSTMAKIARVLALVLLMEVTGERSHDYHYFSLTAASAIYESRFGLPGAVATLGAIEMIVNRDILMH